MPSMDFDINVPFNIYENKFISVYIINVYRWMFTAWGILILQKTI